jgi:hypothetical protein
MWHDILIKFHEDWSGFQAILKFILSNVNGCEVGNTDEK